MAVLTGAGGCSGAAGPVPHARVTAAHRAAVPLNNLTQPEPASATKSLLSAANQEVGTIDDETVSLTNAFIMSDPASAGSLPSTMDQGPRLSAGSYMLTVYCAGSGHVTARLSVGTATASVTAACQTAPEPIRLSVRAPRAGDAIVQVAARDRKPVAVAYKLTSVGLPASTAIQPGR